MYQLCEMKNHGFFLRIIEGESVWMILMKELIQIQWIKYISDVTDENFEKLKVINL